MDTVLSYRGRSVSHSDVAFIGELFATHPQASCRAISRELCQQWQWLQPNGTPRDMVCRGLLLALHRLGHIALPEARYVKKDAWFRRRPELIRSSSTTSPRSFKMQIWLSNLSKSMPINSTAGFSLRHVVTAVDCGAFGLPRCWEPAASSHLRALFD